MDQCMLAYSIGFGLARLMLQRGRSRSKRFPCTFPSVLVRSYTKEKHRRRDAARLAGLGYVVAYKTFPWEGSGRWYVTYKQHRSVEGRGDCTTLMG